MRVIGRKPVLELLRSGKPVRRLLLARGVQGRIIGQIIAEAKKHGVRIDRLARDRVQRELGTANHQGVAADVSPIEVHSLHDLGSSRIPVQTGLLVVLDGVTDPHHLGAIARSSLAAGADALIFPSRRSAPLTETAVKASAGTLNRLPCIQVANLGNTLTALKKEGWWVAGAAGEGSDSLWEMQWPDRLLLVLGSEGEGLSQRVAGLCDHLVRIPMTKNVESLSVSAAASVILFDVLRKRMQGKKS